jgi:hypothetical protein
MSSSVRDITESTEAEGRDDTHQDYRLYVSVRRMWCVSCASRIDSAQMYSSPVLLGLWLEVERCRCR